MKSTIRSTAAEILTGKALPPHGVIDSIRIIANTEFSGAEPTANDFARESDYYTIEHPRLLPAERLTRYGSLEAARFAVSQWISR